MIGQELELDVTNIAHGGHGVARHEGRVVFVRHSIPGERVIGRVTKGTDSSSYLEAEAIAVLEPSPHRVVPPCEYAGPGQCGGCDFQHIAVDEQRRLKAAVIIEQFARLAKKDVQVTVEEIPGAEDGLRWRTRLQLSVNRRGQAGFKRYHSHDVIPVDDCVQAVSEAQVDAVTKRRWPQSTDVHVVVDSYGKRVVTPLPQRKNADTEVAEVVMVGEHKVVSTFNARGFWQVHRGAAQTLVDAVIEAAAVRPGDRILDLYAGVGVLGRAVAASLSGDAEVTLVESDPRTTPGFLERTVERYQMRVENAMEAFAQEQRRWDVIIADPPRSGAGRSVVELMVEIDARRMVYVACDPAALARDTATLEASGWRLQDLRAFDCFPMTHHVECVATFVPVGS